jgi:hypothetical protein
MVPLESHAGTDPALGRFADACLPIRPMGYGVYDEI